MLPVVFQDEHLVAIHKPANLLVHRTTLDARERRYALQLLRAQLGRRVYPVHRLDKGASGVLLFALNPFVARGLADQFARREVNKTYLAVVRGHPPLSGAIDYPLARTVDNGAGAGTPPASIQTAFTRFQRLATAELPYPVDRYPTSRYALLQINPVTGRHHQLRRHMKHISHPIIGDVTYGTGRHNRLFRTLFGCHRLLLACVELRLSHPITAQPLVLTAPLTDDFARLLRPLEWDASVPRHWRA